MQRTNSIQILNVLDYPRKKTLTVEQYIARFHSRIDKIATPELGNKLKSHLLSRKVALPSHETNVIVGITSGRKDVSPTTSAQKCIHTCITNWKLPGIKERKYKPQKSQWKFPRKSPQWETGDHSDPDQNPGQNYSLNFGSERPTFYNYKTSPSPAAKIGEIMNSGACSEVLRKNSLDKALYELKIQGILYVSSAREQHSFADQTLYWCESN